MRVFVDTSGIAALLIRNDANHLLAADALQGLNNEGAELIISNFIIAETYNLLAARTYPGFARQWLLANTWNVEPVVARDEKEARQIIEKYADKDFSYTDAVSFAMMRRLNINTAFTFDHHFAQYGINVLTR
jgi:predicted nucleic acid-binding protein